jgi:predicted aminopeptidase
MRKLGKFLRRWWWIGLIGMGLASCRTVSFYSQAALGQWEIYSKSKPIDSILAESVTPEKLRKKLELVQELRAYARDALNLPSENQYDCYCDLGRKHVVWVVFAAPEFSVEAKTWWYPLVGSLKYRGFFDEKDAEREAESLKKRGFEVYVGGVDAYSTLGWFRDPVLNTFVHRSDAEIAELLFHELTHQRLYLSGDTDFNEAFATAVGEEGARRWLKSKEREKELQVYEAETGLYREFIRLVLDTRERLKNIYGETDGGAMKDRKSQEMANMRKHANALTQKWGGVLSLDRWFATPVNNARLNTLATYYDLVPGFERLLKECDGDLEKFCQRVESMKPLSNDERKALLMRLCESR